jgi:hypothetical protein
MKRWTRPAIVVLPVPAQESRDGMSNGVGESRICEHGEVVVIAVAHSALQIEKILFFEIVGQPGEWPTWSFEKEKKRENRINLLVVASLLGLSTISVRASLWRQWMIVFLRATLNSIKPSRYSLRSIPYSVQAIDRKMKEMPENAVEKMECGTSLAELEFVGEMDVPWKEESSFESPSQGLKGKAPGNLQSIDSLRSLMASDVLKDGASLTTFSSPFEVPRGVSNPSEKRYLDLPLVYCDQTASNRPVKSIEKYIEDVCLPFYGNTHTNTSITGSQSTAFVAEARQIVAEETNAKITGKASLDVVLFA